MINRDFNLCNELRGFERFSSEILKIKNDNEMRQILTKAWSNFRKEQLKHPEDTLPLWNLVEGMGFNQEDPYYVGIGLM